MTVIAYRSGLMAADSCVSQGAMTVGSMPKIVKTPGGWLVGGAGLASTIRTFLKWASNDFAPTSRPTTKPKDLSGIAVSPEGVVHFYEDDWEPFVIDGPYHAIGSGGDAALIAMDMGASAKRAVKAACKRIHGCAEPIVILTLK